MLQTYTRIVTGFRKNLGRWNRSIASEPEMHSDRAQRVPAHDCPRVPRDREVPQPRQALRLSRSAIRRRSRAFAGWGLGQARATSVGTVDQGEASNMKKRRLGNRANDTRL